VVSASRLIYEPWPSASTPKAPTGPSEVDRTPPAVLIMIGPVTINSGAFPLLPVRAAFDRRHAGRRRQWGRRGRGRGQRLRKLGDAQRPDDYCAQRQSEYGLASDGPRRDIHRGGQHPLLRRFQDPDCRLVCRDGTQHHAEHGARQPERRIHRSGDHQRRLGHRLDFADDQKRERRSRRSNDRGRHPGGHCHQWRDNVTDRLSSRQRRADPRGGIRI
jgi:hypothetical protein